MGNRRHVGCALALALLSGACSQLPGSGPTSQAILDRASSPDTSVNFNYVLIDVTDPVLNALSLHPAASLASTFGIGGPAPLLTIGIGDQVNVTIWEAGPGGPFSSSPAETGEGSRTARLPTQEVASDGMISVPYVGRIRAAGLRPAEVESLIVRGLAGKSIGPQAVVTVEHTGNTVSVAGEGTGGKRVPLLPNGERVLDAISDAGGLRINVRDAMVRLTRGSRTVGVPYLAILANPRENIYLRSSDVLTVVSQPRTYTVFGATMKTEEVSFQSDIVTLEEAVATAGGLNDQSADPQGVFLFRFEPSEIVRRMVPDPHSVFGPGVVPVVYRLNFRDAGSFFLARRFEIRDKDIIFVSYHPVADLAKFLAIVGQVVAPAAIGAGVTADYRILTNP
jgi:polysaccharide biosynthesis/export protein